MRSSRLAEDLAAALGVAWEEEDHQLLITMMKKAGIKRLEIFLPPLSPSFPGVGRNEGDAGAGGSHWKKKNDQEVPSRPSKRQNVCVKLKTQPKKDVCVLFC